MMCFAYSEAQSQPKKFQLESLIYTVTSDSTVTLTEMATNTDVTSVVVPSFVTNEGVTYRVSSIQRMAFENQKSLLSVTLPDGILRIEERTFRGCLALTSIVIPNTVTTIGYRAFYECESLTAIFIPAAVDSIGSEFLARCSALKSIEVDNNNAYYNSNNNCNAVIETATNCLVAGCQNTVIPEGVTKIGDGAFSKCYGLTSFSIPNSVTEIGYRAFYRCTSLTSIQLSNNVEYIGKYAFYSCMALTEITLPKSVKTIDWFAFHGCVSLERAVYTGDVEGWCNINFTTKESNPLSYAHNLWLNEQETKTLVIPTSVDTIRDYTFYNAHFTGIIISRSVTNIAQDALYGCNAENIVVEAENPVYDSRDNCNAIIETATNTLIFGGSKTVIPNGVEKIADYAFANNPSVTSLFVPKSVTYITRDVVDSFCAIKSIVVEEGNPVYDSRDNCNAIIETATNTLCMGCSNTIIPNTVDIIGDRAFCGDTTLKYIHIPNGVTTIGNQAFASTAIKAIALPENLQTLGSCAFDQCLQLTSITCNAIRLEKASGIAMEEQITSFTFGNKVKIIPSGICGSMTKLTSIIIPNSVDSIGFTAFMGCSSLTAVVVGENVKLINPFAFYNCTALSDIYCYATNPPQASKAFHDYKATLYVPCDLLEAYKMDSVWGQFADIQCIKSIEVETEEVKVETSTNSVTITWPKEAEADSYTIIVKKEDECVCTLTFNADGQLDNMAFLPALDGNSPSRMATSMGEGFQFTVVGLDEGTQYTYDLIVKDTSDKVISSYEGQFNTAEQTPINEVVIKGLHVVDGTVFCDEPYRIYDMTGRDVTQQNGNLKGVFLVRSISGSTKIIL